MTAISRYLLAVAIGLALMLVLGCPTPPPPREGAATTANGAPAATPKEHGPPRAIIVVDVSASTMKYRSEIYKTVRLFLNEAARDQETDLVFIQLDHKPTLALQFNEARVTEQELKEFEARFSTNGPSGAGTDQVGAMELVLDYAQPTDKQPDSVKVLWFSDMIPDSPKGQAGAFRTWDSFDWSKAKSAGIGAMRFYFVEHVIAKALNTRSESTGVDALFVEPASMLNDLKQGRVQLP